MRSAADSETVFGAIKMIVSASRRTDIPAYYSGWFFQRIKDGYALVRNPFNAEQIRRVSLLPGDVDCFVFWTKNPVPMLNQLNRLADYNFYFQFTLTSYGHDAERNLPSKSRILIPAFLQLAEKIGPQRVIWRYDPIFLTPKYTLDYHLEYFYKIARRLKGYTQICTISFLDYYRSTEKNMKMLEPEKWTREKMRAAAKGLSEIAFSCGIKMDTCAEEIDLADSGIAHASCIDLRLVERICGYKPDAQKDKSQRPECGCAASVDIGIYSSCPNGCKYCYANYNAGTIKKNVLLYDENSPLLCGKLEDKDLISGLNATKTQCGQLNMFDKE